MRTLFCGIVRNRLEEAQANYPVILKYLNPDYTFIVDGESTDGTQEYLKTLDISVISHPFLDFVSQRNLYLDAVEEVADEGDLVVVADSDELFVPSTLEILRTVAPVAYDADANLIRIRCRSEWLNKQDQVVRATLDDYFKPLVALWEPGGRYIGAGRRPIHEELHFPSGRRFWDLDDQDGQYVYIHRKHVGVIYPRALRNLWFADLNPDGTYIPEWQTFRDLLAKYGMTTWQNVEQRFESGDVPEEVKTWLLDRRSNLSSEIRGAFKAFFLYWHTEQLPNELRPEYEKEIIEIHGA